MGIGETFFKQIIDRGSLEQEVFSEQPIIEIAGETRVLIENHRGVCAYDSNKILVHVKNGSVCITGCKLEIIHMTKDQLVIFGKIDSVGLLRRR